MRHVLTAVFATSMFVTPIFAGALVLEATDPQASSEAMAKHAVVVAHTTACVSPEKTTITATAEGLVAGKRQTIPLKVIGLSAPGTYAVAREWPQEGKWTVKMIATNPDYKDYATAIVVPVGNRVSSRAGAKQFFHAPTAEEVDAVLKQVTLE